MLIHPPPPRSLTAEWRPSRQATDCKVWGPKPQKDIGPGSQAGRRRATEPVRQPLRVISVPGHTRGHIAFFCDEPAHPGLLSGDTLFAGAAEGLFEGTPETDGMHHCSVWRPCLTDTRSSLLAPTNNTAGGGGGQPCASPRRASRQSGYKGCALKWWMICAAAGRITLPSRHWPGKENQTPFLRPAVAE